MQVRSDDESINVGTSYCVLDYKWKQCCLFVKRVRVTPENSFGDSRRLSLHCRVYKVRTSEKTNGPAAPADHCHLVMRKLAFCQVPTHTRG